MAEESFGPKGVFHKAWAYAKEHPEESDKGYDKDAFMYVQYWMDRIIETEKAQ